MEALTLKAATLLPLHSYIRQTKLALLTGLYLGNGRHTGVDNEVDSGVGVIWGVLPSFS